MARFRLIVFDLDNTIYDWYSAFLPAFYEMVEVAHRALRCDREALLDELRQVHIRYADVEHPFSILETEIVAGRTKEIGQDAVWHLLDPAFHAFNRVRKENLRIFPGTEDALTELRRRGVRLVAYTDSKYYAAASRVERLGIADLFEWIYCREKSPTQIPAQYQTRRIRALDKIVEIPSHKSKPNPQVLAEIVQTLGECLKSTAYVGDSIVKDVLMAKRAGCFAIWAKYGAHTDSAMYNKLIRISHWTKADIEAEKQYRLEAERTQPDYICENSISELLSIIPSEATDTLAKVMSGYTSPNR